MVDQLKTYSTLDDFLAADWNAEMVNIYGALNSTAITTIPNGSVTEVKMANNANPAVYFAELFADEAVITGFTYVSDSSLSVTITGGTAYVLKTSVTPDKLIRVDIASNQSFTVADNATNFLDLGADGKIDVVQTSSAAADHTRLLKVIALAGSITPTPTDEADRKFLDNIGSKGYIFNMVVDVKSTTEIDLKSGIFVRDSTDAFHIEITADITIDITNSVGVNGLDQGTESASKWYAVLLIASSTGGQVDAGLLVEEANYPASLVLPSGYDIFRRVGWARNDSGSDLLLGLQMNHIFRYDDQITLSAAFNSANFTNIATSTTTPPGARTAAISASDADTASGNTKSFFYTRAGITAGSGGVEAYRSSTGTSGSPGDASVNVVSEVPISTESARNFAGRSTGAIAIIAAVGYRDTLGD